MQEVEATAEQIEKVTSYEFTKKLLCAEAMQMASPQTLAIHEESMIGLDNNKRLSILGNVILTKALCPRWYAARDAQSEDAMSSVLSCLFNDILKAKRGSHLIGPFSATRS
jgi:ribonuclease-3